MELYPNIQKVLAKKLAKPYSNLHTKTGQTMTLNQLSAHLAKHGIVTKARMNSKTKRTTWGRENNS